MAPEGKGKRPLEILDVCVCAPHHGVRGRAELPQGHLGPSWLRLVARTSGVPPWGRGWGCSTSAAARGPRATQGPLRGPLRVRGALSISPAPPPPGDSVSDKRFGVSFFGVLRQGTVFLFEEGKKKPLFGASSS